MNENIDVKCEKVTFDGNTAELENVEYSSIIKTIVNEIGMIQLLNYATDAINDNDNLSDIVEFIDDQYDMEGAINELDGERLEEIKDYLNAE